MVKLVYGTDLDRGRYCTTRPKAEQKRPAKRTHAPRAPRSKGCATPLRAARKGDPEGLDHVAQGVMDHAIAKGRGRDQAPLGLVDVKAGVRAGAVGLGDQFTFQAAQVVLQVKFKRRRRRAAALAPARPTPGPVQVLPGADLGIEMAVRFHNSTLSHSARRGGGGAPPPPPHTKPPQPTPPIFSDSAKKKRPQSTYCK